MHPSQPNYLSSVAGDYFGLNHDESVRVPDNVSTIVDVLDTRGISWGGYFEHMPGPGYLLADFSLGANGAWIYVKEHNGETRPSSHLASFDSIKKNGTRPTQLRSFEAFKRDLAAGNVPQYVMMSLDMRNDGPNTTPEYATKWAHEFLLPLLQSKDSNNNNKDSSKGNTLWEERTVIQLMYDEADSYDQPNRVASPRCCWAQASPREPRGHRRRHFLHALLSPRDGAEQLGPAEPGDGGAGQLAVVRRLSPQRANQLPVPPPNLKLVGAGRKGVLSLVQSVWEELAREKSPYDSSGNIYDGKTIPVYRPQE
ncbi:hypothetical protein PG993_007255 [Apiospora rasikravindrae]|uniref:Uncharacterized protein n=1 Tax=Apiospora rasikravindrae TaxID=990691 RepID=A0ABR1SWZ9_9PEZI